VGVGLRLQLVDPDASSMMKVATTMVVTHAEVLFSTNPLIDEMVEGIDSMPRSELWASCSQCASLGKKALP